MKKEALIAELRATNLEFDENAKYEDLWKLLTAQEGQVLVVSPDDRAERLSEVREPFPPELVERAGKIGMSAEIIDTYADAATLKAACDKISPLTTEEPEARLGDERITKAKPAPLDSFPPELVERAKSIGFSPEQIDTYTDPVSLRMACDQIKPQVTPHPPPEPESPLGPRQPCKPKEGPKGEPAQAVFTSTITTVRAEHLVRAGYDDGNLGAFLRQQKIRPETIQRVTVIRDYVPNERGILTTTMVIDYLKKG
jgi:hypothetical protein